MFFRKTKLVVAAAIAAAVAAVVPAVPAGAALGPCRIQPTDVGIVPGWQFVAVAGVHTSPVGAIGAELTCGVVVNGITYGTVSEDLPGPAAVLAGVVQADFGTATSCYELRVHYLDGSSTFRDTCP
jgi:hypothetical protein